MGSTGASTPPNFGPRRRLRQRLSRILARPIAISSDEHDQRYADAMTNTTSRDHLKAASPNGVTPAVLALDHAARGRQLDLLRQELEHSISERDRLVADLERVHGLRWTRLGARLRRIIKRWRQVRALAVTVIRHPGKVARIIRADLRSSDGARRLVRRLHGDHPDPSGASRALRAEGKHEQALAQLDAALARRPTDTSVLAERTVTLVQMGELSRALENARALVAVSNVAAHRTTEASLAGRLRELDPTWLPTLEPPEPLDSAGTGRILHLLKESRPYYDRGYTMRSHYVLQAQRDAGLHPAVVTSLGFPRLDGFAEFAAVDELDGIPHYRLDLGPDYPYREVPFDRFVNDYARQARRVAATIRPEVIHASSGYRGYETALVALALGRHFGIPVVYDVRSMLEATWTGDIARSQTGEHYGLRVRREEHCMQQADLVFTIAETLRHEIVRRGIDPDKVVVIPNAVDPDAFRPIPPDIPLKRQLGVDGRTVLGYISNIGRREGLDILIEGVARLVQRGRRDIACLIVGEGPELAAVRRLIDARDLGTFVRAVGQVPHEEIQRYYSIIDVFVVPRRNDEAARLVTPLKPFEAMAMERPLLVADLPALLEVAGHDERGLSFRAEDPESLAAQAARLVDDPELRLTLGRAGRGWVANERTWAHNGQRYLEAYGRLTKMGARRD